MLLCGLVMACLAPTANPDGAVETKPVIGPSNLALHDGAEALLAGDGKEGVRLTLQGLRQASSASQRETARSNLCAGYSMLEDYLVALAYCDEVLRDNVNNWRALSNRALIYIKLERYAEADADLLRGEAISPNARTLQAVRRLWLDATNPVSPIIIIDDRRGSAEDIAPHDES
jgi:tetratricopeptide (TPR) repeat protein